MQSQRHRSRSRVRFTFASPQWGLCQGLGGGVPSEELARPPRCSLEAISQEWWTTLWTPPACGRMRIFAGACSGECRDVVLRPVRLSSSAPAVAARNPGAGNASPAFRCPDAPIVSTTSGARLEASAPCAPPDGPAMSRTTAARIWIAKRLKYRTPGIEETAPGRNAPTRCRRASMRTRVGPAGLEPATLRL